MRWRCFFLRERGLTGCVARGPSTLFAVCVIQIKPQLEKLLRLVPDSLTKEIRLTQVCGGCAHLPSR